MQQVSRATSLVRSVCNQLSPFFEKMQVDGMGKKGFRFDIHWAHAFVLKIEGVKYVFMFSIFSCCILKLWPVAVKPVERY